MYEASRSRVSALRSRMLHLRRRMSGIRHGDSAGMPWPGPGLQPLLVHGFYHVGSARRAGAYRLRNGPALFFVPPDVSARLQSPFPAGRSGRWRADTDSTSGPLAETEALLYAVWGAGLPRLGFALINHHL
jgi:hypothetical protein